MVPQEPPTQPTPETVQFTLWFEAPVTVAENCCRARGAMVTLVGEMATDTWDALPTVTTAVRVSDKSKSEVAVTRTVAGLGAAAGAV